MSPRGRSRDRPLREDHLTRLENGPGGGSARIHRWPAERLALRLTSSRLASIEPSRAVAEAPSACLLAWTGLWGPREAP